MFLFGNVKLDLSCLDNYLLISSFELKLQGFYLYYDINNETWIRNGKVTKKDLLLVIKNTVVKNSDSYQSKFHSYYPLSEINNQHFVREKII